MRFQTCFIRKLVSFTFLQYFIHLKVEYKGVLSFFLFLLVYHGAIIKWYSTFSQISTSSFQNLWVRPCHLTGNES